MRASSLFPFRPFVAALTWDLAISCIGDAASTLQIRMKSRSAAVAFVFFFAVQAFVAAETSQQQWSWPWSKKKRNKDEGSSGIVAVVSPFPLFTGDRTSCVRHA